MGQLELHAKTYYNVPGVTTGDEHYVTIIDFFGSGRSHDKPLYSGTSWRMGWGEATNSVSLIGGYLVVTLVLVGNAQMPNCQLNMMTKVPYWFSFPTGSATVNWDANFQDRNKRTCQWAVTQVTN